MITLTLPETETPFKTFTNDQLGDVGTDVQTEPDADRGSIVIRIGLAGICSLQILAEDSATEACLRERLRAAYPILERLCEAIAA